MLKKISISNFYSVGSKQELSFEVKAKDVLDDSACAIDSAHHVNLVSSIIGHNASGKTSVLRALAYLFWFVNESNTSRKSDDETGIEKHKLYLSEPTTLEIEFFNGGVLYRYVISLNEKEVVSEYLGKKNVRSFSRIFEYQRKGDDWNLKTPEVKINSADKERFKRRKNIAMLSSLIDAGYLSEINFFKANRFNVNSMGLRPRSSFLNPFGLFETLHDDKMLCDSVLTYIKDIDLGISDFDFRPVTLRNIEKPETEKTRQLLEIKHGSGKNQFSLPYFEESDGTRQSIMLLSKILPVLKAGKIAVIDEIEDGLHPYVIKKIISLFENKKTNPNNAQLFFSTHQHLLLNDRTKTQIFLAEKPNDTLETEVYRLDEVEGVRNDENYFHKYIAGTYGAVPRIDWL